MLNGENHCATDRCWVDADVTIKMPIFRAQRRIDHVRRNFRELHAPRVTTLIDQHGAEWSPVAIDKFHTWDRSAFERLRDRRKSKRNSRRDNGEDRNRYGAANRVAGFHFSSAARLVTRIVSLKPNLSGRYISSAFVDPAIAVPAERIRAK